jgi:hypothetical protein
LEYPVEKMCKVFKVSRSRYYEWRSYLGSKRNNENRSILFEIRRIHEFSKASYGSPRITKELNKLGYKVSRPRVARIMKQNGIRSVHAKKFKVTTNSNHDYPIMENLLNRNFVATEKASAWVSDITYVKTRKGRYALPFQRRKSIPERINHLANLCSIWYECRQGQWNLWFRRRVFEQCVLSFRTLTDNENIRNLNNPANVPGYSLRTMKLWQFPALEKFIGSKTI